MSENGENLWNNFSDSAFERAVVNELRIDPISVTQSSLFRLESLTVDLVSPEDLKHLVHTPNLISLSIICYGDVDLEELSRLNLLSTLTIKGANVENVDSLVGLRNLSNLDISNSGIGNFSGLRDLINQLADCKHSEI